MITSSRDAQPFSGCCRGAPVLSSLHEAFAASDCLAATPSGRGPPGEPDGKSISDSLLVAECRFSDDELQPGYTGPGYANQVVRLDSNAVDAQQGSASDFANALQGRASEVLDVSSDGFINIVTSLCPSQLRPESRWHGDQFEIGRKLGRGLLSSVRQATHTGSRMSVAIKRVVKSRASVMQRHQVQREIALHATLDHPHILAMYGAYEDEHSYFLILQLAVGGSVYQRLQACGGRYPEDFAVSRVLIPYLSALEYLHDRGIMHRDIKPENGVILGDGRVVLADFGLACDFTLDTASTRLGTLDYMAPEVVRLPVSDAPGQYASQPDFHYGPACDVWGIGTLAYELLTGIPPFLCRSKVQQQHDICCRAPQFTSVVSHPARGFISCALAKDPAARPSAAALLRHAWVASHTPAAVMAHLVARHGCCRQYVVRSPDAPDANAPPASASSTASPSSRSRKPSASSSSSRTLRSSVSSAMLCSVQPTSGGSQSSSGLRHSPARSGPASVTAESPFRMAKARSTSVLHGLMRSGCSSRRGGCDSVGPFTESARPVPAPCLPSASAVPRAARTVPIGDDSMSWGRRCARPGANTSFRADTGGAADAALDAVLEEAVESDAGDLSVHQSEFENRRGSCRLGEAMHGPFWESELKRTPSQHGWSTHASSKHSSCNGSASTPGNLGASHRSEPMAPSLETPPSIEVTLSTPLPTLAIDACRSPSRHHAAALARPVTSLSAMSINTTSSPSLPTIAETPPAASAASPLIAAAGSNVSRSGSEATPKLGKVKSLLTELLRETPPESSLSGALSGADILDAITAVSASAASAAQPWTPSTENDTTRAPFCANLDVPSAGGSLHAEAVPDENHVEGSGGGGCRGGGESAAAPLHRIAVRVLLDVDAHTASGSGHGGTAQQAGETPAAVPIRVATCKGASRLRKTRTVVFAALRHASRGDGATGRNASMRAAPSVDFSARYRPDSPQRVEADGADAPACLAQECLLGFSLSRAARQKKRHWHHSSCGAGGNDKQDSGSARA